MKPRLLLLTLFVLVLTALPVRATGRIVYTGLDPSSTIHHVLFPAATNIFARNAVRWVGQSVNPTVGYAAGNEPGVVLTLLTDAGFTNLTALTASDLAKVDLSIFDVLYIGTVLDGGTYLAAATNVQAFVDAGGGLVSETQTFGMGAWVWMPFADEIGHSGTANPGSENVAIVAPSHPVMTGLTDDDLSNWGQSTHSTFATPEAAGFDTLAVDLDQQGIAQTIARESAECFLVIGDVPGHAPYFGIGHLFATQVGPAVEASWEVLLDDVPEFMLPSASTRTVSTGPLGGSSGVGVTQTGGVAPWMADGRFAVQVLMWNPQVFPGQPEQYTAGLYVTILPNGTVLTEPYGTDVGGLQIWHEIDVNAQGEKIIRFPFSIPGL